jgi:hypothetical protein
MACNSIPVKSRIIALLIRMRVVLGCHEVQCLWVPAGACHRAGEAGPFGGDDE